jgi:hypothetical protein
VQRGLEAENTLHQVLNEIARNGRIGLQAKLEEEYEKGKSPLLVLAHAVLRGSRGFGNRCDPGVAFLQRRQSPLVSLLRRLTVRLAPAFAKGQQ